MCIAWPTNMKIIYLPQSLHNVAKGPDDLALAAIRVLLIDVRLVGRRKEELFEWPCVGQALHSGAEEAAVSQVLKTCHAWGCAGNLQAQRTKHEHREVTSELHQTAPKLTLHRCFGQVNGVLLA